MPIIDRLVVLLAGAAAGVLGDRIAINHTVKHLRRQLSAVTHIAAHDRLTGVLNRAGLEDAYPQTAGAARWLLIVDLDDFKAVNDQYGHPTGDRVLAAMVARVRRLLGQTTGIAGRLGGDEFAVIISRDRQITIDMVAAGLAAPITVTGPDGIRISVTVSVGITAVTTTSAIELALSQADIALYHAKRRGRPVAYRTGMAYPRPPWLRRHARDHDTSVRASSRRNAPRRRALHRRAVHGGELDHRRGA